MHGALAARVGRELLAIGDSPRRSICGAPRRRARARRRRAPARASDARRCCRPRPSSMTSTSVSSSERFVLAPAISCSSAGVLLVLLHRGSWLWNLRSSVAARLDVALALAPPLLSLGLATPSSSSSCALARHAAARAPARCCGKRAERALAASRPASSSSRSAPEVLDLFAHRPPPETKTGTSVRTSPLDESRSRPTPQRGAGAIGRRPGGESSRADRDRIDTSVTRPPDARRRREMVGGTGLEPVTPRL